MSLSPEFLLWVSAGFLAQLVDGTRGMAYGVTASSLLLSLGLPPTTTSATVHTAECFTTGASALRPFVAGYLLLMGGVIVLKAFLEFPPRVPAHAARVAERGLTAVAL